jgi:anthranilate synthase component 1
VAVAPTRDEAIACAADGDTHLALSVELLADVETPISLYRKLRRDGPSFLLESAEGGEVLGRYSFIGVDPVARFEFGGGRGRVERRGGGEDVTFTDPLEVVRALLSRYRVRPRPALPRLQGGAVGHVAYDAVRYFEPTSRPAVGSDREGCFLIVETIVIVDHLRHRVSFVTLMPLEGDRAAAYDEAADRLLELVGRLDSPLRGASPFSPSPGRLPAFEASTSDRRYMESVAEAKRAIEAGEIFQVVLSRRLTVEASPPSLSIYRALRALNPSPYMFHLDLGDRAIVGASPEVLVRVDRSEVLVRPIAGTRPRGRNDAEDLALEAELLADPKELAEHRMLLDLGRNDVGRIARPGSVTVARPLHVERYSHVMHMVSDVVGRLAPGASAFDAFRACFPAGTVSGAPKIRAMEIIGRLEAAPRGFYAGAVGYFDFSGNMDTCIAIRTLEVHPDRVVIQSGAGIVYDSDPRRELEECMSKAKGPLSAIAIAEEIGDDGPDRR